MTNEKIIIVGKSGSGKDHLLNELKTEGYKTAVKITTRPKREHEIDGINYHFRTNQEFDKGIESGEIMINQSFDINGDTWQYGYDRVSFTASNVFILTPNEVDQLKSDDRKQCCVIYLDIETSVRRNRLFERDDNNDKIERRILSDDDDFSEFGDYDVRISDPYFTVDEILSTVF